VLVTTGGGGGGGGLWAVGGKNFWKKKVAALAQKPHTPKPLPRMGEKPKRSRKGKKAAERRTYSGA